MTGAMETLLEEFDKVQIGRESAARFASELRGVGERLPTRVDADPGRVEQGLAKLVLTLIELIRRLLEKQALRRIEAGGLSDDEIERMGLTFMRLEEKVQELTAIFGLEPDDLNLNLGPLGDLM